MESIEELREYASHCAGGMGGDALRHMADAIEAEVAERYIALPTDADGAPWHIGDRTESGQTIRALGLNRHGWHFTGTVNDADPSIHHHATVEGLLQKLLVQAVGYSDAHTTAALDAIAEYAAKLRLAGDGE